MHSLSRATKNITKSRPTHPIFVKQAELQFIFTDGVRHELKNLVTSWFRSDRDKVRTRAELACCSGFVARRPVMWFD